MEEFNIILTRAEDAIYDFIHAHDLSAEDKSKLLLAASKVNEAYWTLPDRQF